LNGLITYKVKGSFMFILTDIHTRLMNVRMSEILNLEFIVLDQARCVF